MSRITMLVFRKELIDIFRDKKTIIISILIPLLIFPVMFSFIGRSINKTTKSVENNLKIAMKDSGNSSLASFIKEQKNVTVVKSENITDAVKDGSAFLGIDIPEGFDAAVNKETAASITITYDDSSQQSQTALAIINSYIEQYSKGQVAQRLTKRNIDVSILTPIIVQTKTAAKESDGGAKLMLSLLLPLLLIVYSVTGPLAAATDLGAGEKERGTLEPLLTTQASRMSLLWGKFLAITVMGLITTIASMTGMFISMKQKNGLFSATSQGGAGAVSLEPKALIFIGIVAVLVTMVFGALELSISIYARSFKEASTYLSPLTIVAIIPAYATYMMDAKSIETVYFHIPLANAVCLIKEFIAGIYKVDHMLITFAWIIFYIVGSLLFARFMFSREEVIFRT